MEDWNMKSKWPLILTIIVVLAIVVAIIIRMSTHDSAPNTARQNEKEMVTDTQSQPHQGAKENKIVIVEYGDFKCPYCGAFERNIKPQLQKEYIDTQKVQFRYVNVLIHGEESELSAKAALAVNQYAPNQYWAFHKLLYQGQPSNKDDVTTKHWLTDNFIQQQLKKLDLSPKQLEKITSAYRDKNGEIAKKAQNDNNLAKKYKVPQVPSLYINGEPIEDTKDFDTIKSKVDQVIKDQKS